MIYMIARWWVTFDLGQFLFVQTGDGEEKQAYIAFDATRQQHKEFANYKKHR